MKTDIEIAQEAVMEPIKNVAARCGISEDDLELYGKYKAKIASELCKPNLSAIFYLVSDGAVFFQFVPHRFYGDL